MAIGYRFTARLHHVIILQSQSTQVRMFVAHVPQSYPSWQLTYQACLPRGKTLRLGRHSAQLQHLLRRVGRPRPPAGSDIASFFLGLTWHWDLGLNLEL